MAMAGTNHDAFRLLRLKKGDDLATVYLRARKAFTADDLQRYTTVETGIPAEQLLAELDAIHREERRKLKHRAGRNRKHQA
jgi:hypothetical protein